MKRYIKFHNDAAIEAPATKIKDGIQIIGYNKESNETMLLEDGYMIYTGSRPLSDLSLVDGQIVEAPEEVVKQTIFTKLQIRRAMRALNMEDQLNALLNSSPTILADWTDAQIIDLDDPVLKAAVAQAGFSQETIDTVIAEIEAENENPQ